MTEIPIDILFDDAAEILLPRQCGKGARRAAACVCCGLAGQANGCNAAVFDAYTLADGLARVVIGQYRTVIEAKQLVDLR